MIIGETWLDKASAAEVAAGLAFTEVYGRDPYSFWALLDARSVLSVVALARSIGADLVSFFWSTYLFAYVPYETASSLPLVERNRVAAQAANEAMARGSVTLAGAAFRRAATGT